MYPIRTRAERARLHLAMLDILPETSQSQAFAEAVAWAETGEIADLATLLRLADAIEQHAYYSIHHSDYQFAEIDADDLRAALGSATVNLALKLAGFNPRQRGNKMYWSNAIENEPTISLKLPTALWLE